MYNPFSRSRLAVSICGIGIIMGVLAFMPEHSSIAQEAKQAVQGAAGQLIAMPLAIHAGQEGLVLIDPHKQTLCLYYYDFNALPHERLKLIAARDFSADMELDNFNCGEPTPQQVRDLLGKTVNEPAEKEVKKE